MCGGVIFAQFHLFITAPHAQEYFQEYFYYEESFDLQQKGFWGTQRAAVKREMKGRFSVTVGSNVFELLGGTVGYKPNK